jgi:hypothetical protein
MKTKRISRLLAAALMCLLFTSCDASIHPLSSPEDAKADHQLDGKWIFKDVHGDIQYQFIPVGGKLPDCIMESVETFKAKDEATTSTEKQDNQKEKKHRLFFPTQIGDRHFLNSFEVSEKSFKQLKERGWKPYLIEGYEIYLYKVQNDQLTLFFIEDDSVKNAIKEGKIKGVVKNAPSSIFPDDNWYLTDSTENINDFFGSLDEKHFEELMSLNKAK